MSVQNNKINSKKKYVFYYSFKSRSQIGIVVALFD